MLSITDARFDEQFGFTEEEVRKLLAFYHLESHLSEIKNWYDGYRFGNADIFCPWDVIGHVDRLMEDPEAEPQPYWINTSGNDLVKRFIDKADKTTRDEIERLMTGGTIEKEIRMELTYEEIDRSIDNLWSVLFTTGYLTLEGEPEYGICRLRIPNEEVREVFRYQIRELFRENVMKNTAELEIFWRAFSDGEGKVIEEQLNRLLGNSISVFDTRGDRRERENSYHTFLLGMLVGNAAWGVKSNRETGEGFADLLVETENPDAGIIIELKSVDRLSELDEACRQAIAQIHERRYDRTMRDEGRDDILAYGIAFYKKRCRVAVEKM